MTVYVRTPFKNISHLTRHPRFSMEMPKENARVHFPIDVIEDNEKFIVSAILPGIEPEQVDIQIKDKQIILEGEFKVLESEGDSFILRERPTGKFHRSISLPDMVNAAKAEAKMANGILSISIPKSEEAKPKKIKVTSN